MKTLTLEHLDFTNNSKVRLTRNPHWDFKEVNLQDCELNFNSSDKQPYLRYKDVTFGLDQVKIYRRPLSDLTKEIEHNGEKFVPMVELLKLAHESYYKEKIGTRYQEIEFEQTPIRAKACFSFMATKDLELYTLMPWNFPTWITQKLLSWHFDIHGLIEQNLAININTLEK